MLVRTALLAAAAVGALAAAKPAEAHYYRYGYGPYYGPRYAYRPYRPYYYPGYAYRPLVVVPPPPVYYRPPPPVYAPYGYYYR